MIDPKQLPEMAWPPHAQACQIYNNLESMVRLQLSIKAELENIDSIIPASENFEYFFKVKCSSCNEEHPKLVSLNRVEEHDLSGSRGSASFVWRCGLCKRESSAKFDSTQTKAYTSEANSQFAPILTIECRGLEFVGFDPQGTWKATGTTGQVFPEVDLTDGEWNDYDEKAALPVGISEIEAQWSRA